MKGFAIHNAPTNHGGRIPSTQVRSSQEGNLFVRAGDGHFCPKCKVWSTVQPSHNHVIFDGKAVLNPYQLPGVQYYAIGIKR